MTADNLNKYSKQQLVDMLLEREAVSKNITDLTTEVKRLTGVVSRLETDLSVVRHVNDALRNQLISTERQCWANAQYSRRECMEISGMPSSVGDNDLEEKVLKVFDKLDKFVPVTEDNVEACHRIKQGSDKLIIKLSKRKHCQQIMQVKKDLKNMDMRDIDLPVGTTLFLNESLCSYYRWPWSNCKVLKNKNLIHSFYTVNGTLKVKHHEGDRPCPITHIEDLKELVPGYDFSKK